MKCWISSLSPIVRGWRLTSAMLIMLTVIWQGVYWKSWLMTTLGSASRLRSMTIRHGVLRGRSGR